MYRGLMFFKNIMVIYMTVVCICWLKLWKMNCSAWHGMDSVTSVLFRDSVHTMQ